MKYALITGGARGIGLETAKLLISKGWRVALYDIDQKNLELALKEINSELVSIYSGDINDVNGLKEVLVDFTQASQGALHLLVNNAAILEVGDFETKTLEQHLRIVDVNLKGTITCTFTALSFLQAAKGSCIINLSSASALYGHPEIPVYAASKAAIKSLTEAWHLGLKRYHIKVADVLPIFVRTKMVTDYADQYRNLPLSKVKLTPERVAEVIWKAVNGNQIHYLVGKETAGYSLLLRFLPQKWIPIIARKVIGYND